MQKTIKCNLHNRFDIEVHDAKTGDLKQKVQAENMILNSLWARALSTTSSGYAGAIHVGTGTGTLAPTRTSLFTFLLGKSTSGTEVFSKDLAAGYCSMRRSITILENQAVGSILTEVGTAIDTGSTTLVTHAMLQDMNGNPVSIEKTDTDIITIYATIYVYVGTAGWADGGLRVLAGNFSMPAIRRFLGESYSAASWNYSFNQIRGWCEYSGPSSNNQYTVASVQTTQTFDVANKRVTQYGRLGAAAGNAGGIRSVTISGTFHFDLYDSGALSGRSITGEAIGTGDGSAVDFKTAFPQVKAGAKVYVDGVEQTSGITIDLDRPSSNDLTLELRVLEMTNSQLQLGRKDTYLGQTGDILVVENPYYQAYGIDSAMVGNDLAIYSSDDLVTWTYIRDGAGKFSATPIDAAHRSKRYFKFVMVTAPYYNSVMYRFMSNDLPSTVNNIHFATPPAIGAVITADYTTALAPKDVNHVFDLTIVWQLGEYIP